VVTIEAALEVFKRRVRATWAAGDYATIAERDLWPIGERIVRRVGVRPDDEVLDVGCGTGNAALRAAQAGGRVTGVDLTPELFAHGRRLAAHAGVDVAWVPGDAEALPFEDARFDIVLSTFGCMFAPRHDVAAREMARVLRTGGRLGVCSWTPDSKVGRVFQTVGAYMPPPPPFASPPTLWGSEEHVRTLFEGTGLELEFDRGVADDGTPPDAPEDEIEFLSATFGPMMNARRLAESQGRWPSLHRDLVAVYRDSDPAEYLVVLGRKRGEPERRVRSSG